MSRDTDKEIPDSSGSSQRREEERLLHGCNHLRAVVRKCAAMHQTEISLPRRHQETVTPRSIVLDDVENGIENNDDDPPPYAAIVPPNHVGWPFTYSVHATSPSSATPFAVVERQPVAILPSAPCRIFKFGSHRSLFVRSAECLDGTCDAKASNSKTRRYSGILVAAIVIISLMALSLMVRLLMEKSFWRG